MFASDIVTHLVTPAATHIIVPIIQNLVTHIHSYISTYYMIIYKETIIFQSPTNQNNVYGNVDTNALNDTESA